ncbi:MAG: hypothetical protein EHM20_02765 [Alphaproteobacteria bacterium]|nr:MAG: hypothetical protein EHM20_02765 [Alphaproteobacteria bacterium]
MRKALRSKGLSKRFGMPFLFPTLGLLTVLIGLFLLVPHNLFSQYIQPPPCEDEVSCVKGVSVKGRVRCQSDANGVISCCPKGEMLMGDNCVKNIAPSTSTETAPCKDIGRLKCKNESTRIICDGSKWVDFACSWDTACVNGKCLKYYAPPSGTPSSTYCSRNKVETKKCTIFDTGIHIVGYQTRECNLKTHTWGAWTECRHF